MRKLNAAQRESWQIDGYIQLPQVLTSDEVDFFTEQIDQIRLKPGYEPLSSPLGHYDRVPHAPDLDPQGFMDRRDLLSYHQAFIDLIDRPSVFDLVVDIMGPYLSFSMSQAIVRPATSDFPGYTHTDGGEAMREIRVTESSRPLAVKALYLLTDVDEPDTGNFTVFPGSHLRPFPVGRKPALTPHSAGAVQLTGKAGDCILFPHSLWHGPAPNLSDRARKTLLYNYCQLSIRPYDYASVADVVGSLSPRQKRLLGQLGYDFRPGSYVYAPQDQIEVITGSKP